MTTYFVIYDTVHLWQNYSVDEYRTKQDAFRKLRETKTIEGWDGWVAMELEETEEIEIPAERLKVLE